MYLKTRKVNPIEKHLNNVFEMLNHEEVEIIQRYILDHLLEEDDENDSEIIFEAFYDPIDERYL